MMSMLMNKSSLYNKMPFFFKNIIGSIYGASLKVWRYGPETDSLVEDALSRESWSKEQWDAWQKKRLRYILELASSNVPYYQDYWKMNRGLDIYNLQNWPILEKETLRKHPEKFIVNGVNRSKLFHMHTSGSTGTPINLWIDRKSLRFWYALFEARWRVAYGVSRHDKWAILGGQMIVPAEVKSPPYWVKNNAMKQLYMSCLHLSKDSCSDYLQALKNFSPRYLWGYSSALESLAMYGPDGAGAELGLKVIITNGEPLYSYQRNRIESYFKCAVKETYGMAEMVLGASEDQHGQLKLWPESGILEIVNGKGENAGGGETGEFIATGLVNEVMPLIRYRVGDRGSILDADAVKEDSMPRLSSLEGRSDDVLITPDGFEVGRLDHVFKGDLPIRSAQIIQRDSHTIEVLVLPEDETLSEDIQNKIIHGLVDRMGSQMTYRVKQVDRIPCGSNGKVKGVVNLISRGQRCEN